MENARIKAVIIAVSIALLGLIAVQVFWVKNSIALQEQRFAQAVNQALQNIVNKLERSEAEVFLLKGDSIKGLSMVSREEFHYVRKGEGTEDTRPIVINSRQDMPGGGPGRGRAEQCPVSDAVNQGIHIEREIKQREVKERRIVVRDLDSTEWLNRKEELLNNMIGRLALSKSMDVKERINKAHFDSLMKAELNAFGVDIPFDYNIKNKFTGKLVYEIPPIDSKGESVFKADLFPYDLRGSKEELLLFFPKTRLFILGQIGGMLLTSLLFLVIIILLFYHTIATLIRQKKISEIKTDFVNNMTHELKTPISTISLACEALSDPDVQGKGDSYLGMIKTESKRLANLVEKVLQSALFEQQGIKLKKETIRITDVIDQAIKHLEIHLEKARVKLAWHPEEMEANLPGDRLQLVNLFYNLLDNAIKYSGKTPEIIISCLVKDDKLQVKVQDNGIGISRENQKRVFEKLYRVPMGDTHNVKGFGLGLSYVKSIAEAHGGFVLLESEEGKGSVFTVVLPLKEIDGKN